MNRRAPRVQGFTLIELLVVIAIIAILAAILFPIFKRAKDAGQRASCESNLQQMYKALIAYSDDYSSRLPWANAWYYGYSWGQPSAPPPDERWIGQLLRTYAARSRRIFNCPANTYKMYDPGFGASWNWVFYYNLFNGSPWSALDACPDPDSLAGQPLVAPDFIVSWMPGKNGQPRSWRYTRVTRVPIAWDQRRTVWDTVKNRPATDRVYELIHYGGWNILFSDGHAKYFTEKDRSPYMPE